MIVIRKLFQKEWKLTGEIKKMKTLGIELFTTVNNQNPDFMKKYISNKTKC